MEAEARDSWLAHPYTIRARKDLQQQVRDTYDVLLQRASRSTDSEVAIACAKYTMVRRLLDFYKGTAEEQTR